MTREINYWISCFLNLFSNFFIIHFTAFFREASIIIPRPIYRYRNKEWFDIFSLNNSKIICKSSYSGDSSYVSFALKFLNLLVFLQIILMIIRIFNSECICSRLSFPFLFCVFTCVFPRN